MVKFVSLLVYKSRTILWSKGSEDNGRRGQRKCRVEAGLCRTSWVSIEKNGK